MKYCVNPSDDEPIMLIDKHIGDDEEDGMGIDGALFQRELLQLDAMGKKRIEVWINSPGGKLFHAWPIVNSILNSKTPVDTYNIGMAASSASFIFMAGRKRYMADYAVLMIHNPYNANDPDAPVLKVMSDSVLKMTASRSKLSEENVQEMLNATTWMNSEECIDAGFCTEAIETKGSNQKWMPISASVREAWKKVAAIANAEFPAHKINHSQQKTSVMNKVTQTLGLIEGANEELVVDAIKGIKDKVYTSETAALKAKDDAVAEIRKIEAKAATDVAAATKVADDAKAEVVTAKAEVVDITAKLTDVQAKLDASTKELTDIKAKYDAMEKEKNDAIEAQKATDAKALVDVHVKSGRIKNETKIIEKWVAMATEDLDGTKEMIEALPLSVKSPVFQTEVAKTDVTGIHATTPMALAVKNRLKRQGKEIPA